MARPLRIEYPGAWYHVMNRGRRKEEIFQDDRDREMYLEVLDQTFRLFKIEIHAYSLMANHYHLLLCTPEGNLARAIRHLNGVYTQKYNKRHKIDGSLFRGRYKSIVVDKESYLLEVVRYIHRNAIKAGLEKKPGEYKWDSHSAYMNGRQSPKWLMTEEVLSKFSKYEKEARREMRAFVNMEVPKDLLKKLESVNWPSMLGGKKFKEKIRDIVKGKEIDSCEIKGYKDYREKGYNEENIKKIIFAKQDILEKRRSRKLSGERKAIIYLLRMYGKTLKEIGLCMGGISYVSVSRQYKYAEEEINKKAGCYNHLKEITKILKLQV